MRIDISPYERVVIYKVSYYYHKYGYAFSHIK